MAIYKFIFFYVSSLLFRLFVQELKKLLGYSTLFNVCRLSPTRLRLALPIGNVHLFCIGMRGVNFSVVKSYSAVEKTATYLSNHLFLAKNSHGKYWKANINKNQWLWLSINLIIFNVFSSSKVCKDARQRRWAALAHCQRIFGPFFLCFTNLYPEIQIANVPCFVRNNTGTEKKIYFIQNIGTTITSYYYFGT